MRPRPNNSSPLLGALTIILTLLGWSSIPLFLRHFSHLIDAWTANGWRYGFSAAMWAPVLIVGARRKTLTKALWKAAVIPSVFNIAGQICFALAPYYVKPGLMTFSLRVQILFVTLGAAVLFAAERKVIKRPGFIVGIVCVVFGTMATILLKPGGLGSGTGLGVVLSVSAGVLYAGYALSVRHFMHGVNPWLAFGVISQYTAAGILVPMIIWGTRSGGAALDLSTQQFSLLLLSSLIGIGLGHTLYYFSIGRLGLAVSSGVVQLQPFLVSVASMFLFDEKLTALQWVTGTVAIFGAILILVEQSRVARAGRSPESLVLGPESSEPDLPPVSQDPPQSSVPQPTRGV